MIFVGLDEDQLWGVSNKHGGEVMSSSFQYREFQELL